MQKSAMCTKLNKQFASGFAVGSLFPFFVERAFPFAGKSFFLPVSRKAEPDKRKSGGNCDAACKCCEHRRKTA